MKKRARLSLIIFALLSLVCSGLLIVAAIEVSSLARTDSHITSYMRRADRSNAPAYTPLSGISPYLACSVIKAEDLHFFHHHGVDWEQVFKRISPEVQSRRKGGASTITQQLARNFYLNAEFSLIRKLREAGYAAMIEWQLPKERILELYLNHIEWGADTWGITEASDHFFGESPANLSIPQSVFLASLIAAPKKSWEGSNLERMASLYRRISRELLFSGIISAEEFKDLKERWQTFSAGELRDVAGARRVFARAAGERVTAGKLNFLMDREHPGFFQACGLKQQMASSQLARLQRGPADTRTADSERDLAQQYFLSRSPSLVSVASATEAMLFKRDRLDGVDLFIVDRGHRNLIALRRELFSSLAMSWRPDGGALALVRENQNGMLELVIWNLEDVTDTIVSRFSGRRISSMRWAPDGTALAVIEVPESTHKSELKIENLTPRSTQLVSMVSKKGSFDWSPDGKHLISVVDEAPGSIEIFGKMNSDRRRIQIVNGDCYSVHWGTSPAGVLLSCRDKKDEFISLYQLDTVTGSHSKVISREQDVVMPVWHPDNRSIFFHLKSDSGISIHLFSPATGEERIIGPEDGFSIISGFTPDRLKLFLSYTGMRQPAIFYQADFSGNLTRIFESPGLAGLSPVTPVVVRLAARDGTIIPTVVWSPANRNQAPRGALLVVHGGPDMQALPVWNPLYQYLAARGMAVVVPNFRGSSGFGASFEKGAHQDRAQDILAAEEYIRSRFELAAPQITLMGYSYGASLAIDVLRDNLLRFGRMVLISPSLPSGGNRDRIEFTGEVAIFSGAKDSKNLRARARKAIEVWFGSDVFWREFAQEGHIFTSIQANAELADFLARSAH